MFEYKRTTLHQKRRIMLRIWVAGIFALACFLGLVGRLWYLQVERYEGFAARADQNRIAVVPIPPRRGEILDRNGKEIVTNRPSLTVVAEADVLDEDDEEAGHAYEDDEEDEDEEEEEEEEEEEDAMEEGGD